MLGSDVLEVALGLVLTFLLLSIVMTGIEELLSSIFKTRAKNLELALLQIMQQDKGLVDALYEHPLVAALYRGEYAPSQRWKPWRNALPSYIPREIFAAALADLENRVGPESRAKLREILETLPADTHGRLGTARQKIESWYDGAMDRASGWYKRRTQTRLFIIGIVGAVLFNVNTISVAHYLAVHPEQRDLVAKLADRVATEGVEGAEGGAGRRYCVREGETRLVVEQDEAIANATAEPFDASENAAADAEAATVKAAPAPTPTNVACWTSDQVRDYTNALVETGVPVGWSEGSREWLYRGFPKGEAADWPAWIVAWLLILLGYFITAVAITLGAPFWFDVLNKIMVIRGTVKPKEKSPDEPPIDGPKRRSTKS